jgi:divalent metal cation (Fe/Co/Zn/Cd) transporter
MAGRASTRVTVLIAGAANVLVGAIKLTAGIMVGSSAMLAEAAHSAADTLNQGFLLTSVHRGERPADSRHPCAATPRDLAVIRAEIENAPGIDALLDLRTMHLGPDQLIVAARVAFDDEISADQAEDVADEIDRRLASRLPQVQHVFLDPTQASSGSRPAAPR